MKKLLTQKELCELLSISYPTLNRMMNDGRFIQPVNGRGKKLLFDHDAVDAWLSEKNRAPPQVSVPPGRSEKQRARDFAERQERAQRALERHGFNRK